MGKRGVRRTCMGRRKHWGRDAERKGCVKKGAWVRGGTRGEGVERIYKGSRKMGLWGGEGARRKECQEERLSGGRDVERMELLMTFLQRHLSQKFLYVSCHLIFVAGCIAAVSLTKHIFIIFLLCLSAGPYQVVLMTVPYNILAQYHKCNKYKSPEEGLPRGLGTDMACLDSQSYLGQIAISAIMGPLIQLTGSHLTIIALSGLMSLIAALSAAFLVAYEIVEDGDSDTENENVA
ncbi:proton-associated sugar transporter A-like [Diadema antillarum]|uniref:proton-associated sugar transporter A-like n=1 Tax=Diadema antillarum TaxID=105358 RepID=UPI003A86B3B0